MSTEVISIDEYKVNKFAENIAASVNDAAMGILEVGRQVVEAEASMSPDELKALKSQLAANRVMSASTWTKFKKIGECRALQQTEIQKALPSSWTSLYRIAVLPENVVTAAVDAGAIHPDMKATEIRDLTPGKRPAPTTVVVAEVCVPRETKSTTIYAMRGDLKAVVDEYGFELKDRGAKLVDAA